MVRINWQVVNSVVKPKIKKVATINKNLIEFQFNLYKTFQTTIITIHETNIYELKLCTVTNFN